ncbi:MAG: superoxide dismutase family protein [Chitinophagaceae bacterium]|nr:superoxide dismutase family protein [Chitinophagaceae bacterium]
MAQDSAYIQSAEAVLSGTGPDTTLSGQARFQSQPNGQVRMLLEITVTQKANSTVAVHLHEHGDCGDMGNNAHGHWNPTNENHGRWGQGNYHSGDIGNVELDSEGKGIMEMTTDRWTIGGDSTKNILNKAVIVHSGVDDYTTQPTGNAGSRIGCGVINQIN